VVVTDIDAHALAHVRGNNAVGAAFFELDVTKPDSWDRVLDQCEGAVGPIDILCSNAGVSAVGTPVEDLPIGYWERVFEVNVTGALIGIQKVLERMRARGTKGHIMTTASTAGIGVVGPGAAAYACSKSAVVTLMEVLRMELVADGIGVSLFCPGPVRTQLWRTSRNILGLPELHEPPEVARTVGSASDAAMDPLEAGRIAVAGIQFNRTYIFSHPEARAEVERRNARILEAFDATPVQNSLGGRGA
jgi:NAD(P)-dependent dehydrogenase (short-subunit alcohol dehydrogenase family)